MWESCGGNTSHNDKIHRGGQSTWLSRRAYTLILKFQKSIYWVVLRKFENKSCAILA